MMDDLPDDDELDGNEIDVPCVPRPVNPMRFNWKKVDGRWLNTGDGPDIPLFMKADAMEPSWAKNNGNPAVIESDFDTVAMLEFFRENPIQHLVRMDKNFNLKDGPFRILDYILSVLPTDTTRVFQVYEKNRRIQGFWHGNPIHIEISYRDTEDGIIATNIEMFGDREFLKSVRKTLEAEFEAESAVPILWWHKGQHGVGSRKVFLPDNKTRIVPELYPDISPEPNTYVQRYLESDASVLLMAGPPGTGKTTLLRHMIKDHNLGAHVIYDESLMSNDGIFHSFLFESSGDILIIEDADLLLAPRETDQNKLMSRFLNVSDGLIKLPNKKLVFTTNISDFNKVDPAIIRPGRCFGVLHTRPLDLNEAQAAARACDLPIPATKRQYTLADLFSQQAQAVTPRRVGFVASAS